MLGLKGRAAGGGWDSMASEGWVQGGWKETALSVVSVVSVLNVLNILRVLIVDRRRSGIASASGSVVRRSRTSIASASSSASAGSVLSIAAPGVVVSGLLGLEHLLSNLDISCLPSIELLVAFRTVLLADRIIDQVVTLGDIHKTFAYGLALLFQLLVPMSRTKAGRIGHLRKGHQAPFPTFL